MRRQTLQRPFRWRAVRDVSQVADFVCEVAMSHTPEHSGTAHRKLIACLLAVEVADYDANPVFDQIRLTHDFHNLLVDATTHATSYSLVSVVGEDGALLGFLADPEECFKTAFAIREATLTQDRYRDLSLRIGISLGKAEIAEDEFGHAHMSGEGRQDAERIMRQGPPRQISVGRQFVELLGRTAPELAESLEYQGLCFDSVGPPLCLYRASAPQDAESESRSDRPPTPSVSSRVIAAPARSDVTPIGVSAQSKTESRNWLRSSWLGYRLLPLLAGAALVSSSSRLGVEAPVFMPVAQIVTTPQITVPEAPASLPAHVAPEAVSRAGVTAPAVLVDAPYRPRPVALRRAMPTQEPALVAPRIEERAPVTFNDAAAPEETREGRAGADQLSEAASVQASGSATLFLAVKPWGEVYVDGRRIGVTPPLKRFEIPLGRHLITIINSSLPIFQREVTVGSDANMTVTHDFSCASVRDKICREGFGKGLELPSRVRLETAEAARSQ